jgi:hypothetical protein
VTRVRILRVALLLFPVGRSRRKIHPTLSSLSRERERERESLIFGIRPLLDREKARGGETTDDTAVRRITKHVSRSRERTGRKSPEINLRYRDVTIRCNAAF